MFNSLRYSVETRSTFEVNCWVSFLLAYDECIMQRRAYSRINLG